MIEDLGRSAKPSEEVGLPNEDRSGATRGGGGTLWPACMLQFLVVIRRDQVIGFRSLSPLLRRRPAVLLGQLHGHPISSMLTENKRR